MANILGIDEAGRGPVIGPMVMAGFLLHETELEQIAGIRESKQLSERQRELTFERISKLGKHHIAILSPQEIDEALLSDSLNLNWLEAHTSATIINALQPDIAYIDSPSNNIKKYTSYLMKLLENPKIIFFVEHKADVHHPIVAAASILAKVTRDREITKLQKKIPFPLGSGYPSDPVTMNFLRNHYQEYPHIFRKTWAPYQEIIKEKDQKKLGQYYKKV